MQIEDNGLGFFPALIGVAGSILAAKAAASGQKKAVKANIKASAAQSAAEQKTALQIQQMKMQEAREKAAMIQKLVPIGLIAGGALLLVFMLKKD